MLKSGVMSVFKGGLKYSRIFSILLFIIFLTSNRCVCFFQPELRGLLRGSAVALRLCSTLCSRSCDRKNRCNRSRSWRTNTNMVPAQPLCWSLCNFTPVETSLVVCFNLPVCFVSTFINSIITENNRYSEKQKNIELGRCTVLSYRKCPTSFYSVWLNTFQKSSQTFNLKTYGVQWLCPQHFSKRSGKFDLPLKNGENLSDKKRIQNRYLPTLGSAKL